MSILDLFFPTQVKCVFCNAETPKFGICKKCYEALPFIKQPVCHKCGGERLSKDLVCIECKNRHFDFESCFSIFYYKDEIQKKIVSFKQGGNKYIGYAFAWIIDEKYNELGLNEIIDVIIPVPINENRLKERGFNQSKILCNELMTTGKVNTEVLKRVKDTPHQTGLNRENRQSNLKDGFVVTKENLINNKTILLVDDIYTTGSTLNECAKTLIKAGAKKVVAMCLARTPIDNDRILKPN